MAKLSPTDLRILKFVKDGCSLEKVAKKIGRPGDIARVQEAIDKEKQ